MSFFEEEQECTRWEFQDSIVYTFKHERHMYEFMAYRDYDSFGKSKLFAGTQTYEVRMKKSNFKFEYQQFFV